MPKQILHRFEVSSLSILNSQGEPDPQLEPQLPASQLKRMFENMILTREFDRRSIALQRQGRMGTYAPAWGQEAIHIGSAAAMQVNDWAVPAFREQGVYLSRGVKATTLFLFFMGSEDGNRLPRHLHILPYCVPCSTQLLHAVGIAMAAKIKKDPIAVLTYFGDGASSEGDFHEALNFAGVFLAPSVFICQNNQWAISTPRSEQTRSASIAQKALAYGFEGIQVDGNDVLAVYQATQAALQGARNGSGPSLLECLTYRMGVHTTADDPSRYRDETEVKSWIEKDPIDRFEKYLLRKNILQKDEREVITIQIADQLKADAAAAEEMSRDLSTDDMFAYMYAEWPEVFRPQREDANKSTATPQSGGRAHG